MLARLKRNGEWIDVYRSGSVISSNGVESVFIRYGDKYHYPIYSSELVFEDYKKTKQHFVNKACKWLNDNIDLVAMVTIRAKDNHHQIVMMKNFEQEFKKAMEE